MQNLAHHRHALKVLFLSSHLNHWQVITAVVVGAIEPMKPWSADLAAAAASRLVSQLSLPHCLCFFIS